MKNCERHTWTCRPISDDVWWEVGLASKSFIHSINVYSVSLYYLSEIKLEIYDDENQLKVIDLYEFEGDSSLDGDRLTISLPEPIVGDRVRLLLPEYGDELTGSWVKVCEVEVNGIPLDECGSQTLQNINGISSNVLDGEDCPIFQFEPIK